MRTTGSGLPLGSPPGGVAAEVDGVGLVDGLGELGAPAAVRLSRSEPA